MRHRSAIWFPILVSGGERRNLREVSLAIEGERHEPFANHREHERHVAEVECCFRENRFARQQRAGDLLREAHGLVVVAIAAIAKRDEEARISDSLHFFEKPFRVERSRGPDNAPARRMNDRSPRFSRPAAS